MFRSSNPAIKSLSKYETNAENHATYAGVTGKTIFLVLITLASALITTAFLPQLMLNPEVLIMLLIGSSVVAVASALVSAFAPSTSKIFATLYCAAEGVMVGLLSSILDAAYSGIVVMALLSTFIVLLVMMGLYYSGLVKVTSKFRKVMFVSLISLIASQLLFFVLSLFVPSLAFAYASNFLLQLVISIVMIVVASLMLLVDLDNITIVVNNNLDKKFEWRAAFGLVVTLIWLYLEFLRLFSVIMAKKN